MVLKIIREQQRVDELRLKQFLEINILNISYCFLFNKYGESKCIERVYKHKLNLFNQSKESTLSF